MLRNKKAYYSAYTILFFLTAFFGIYYFFLKDGLTVFKTWDSYDQQYMAFVRIGRWLRTVVREGRIQVWSPSIGYGGDFFLSLSPYIMDPFNWLSGLIPSEWAETAFTATLFLKAWLTGITFSVFAFRRKHEPYAVLCGALSYAISGTAFLCLYQSQFFMPMIMFPLVVLGTDRLFDEKKPALFVLSLAWSALNSFYHTYMIAVLVIVYILLRWFDQPKAERSGKKFLRLFCSCFLYAALAAGIAAVSLLPMAKLMASMSRIGLEHEVPAFYTESYYLKILRGMTATVTAGADAYIGFSAPAAACVFFLFITGKKKHHRIRTETVLMLIALCIPALGYMLNGFGYVTNRWVWGLTFLTAYLTTLLLPEAGQMKTWQRILLPVSAALYVTATLLFADGLKTHLYLWICGALLLFCVFLSFGRRIPGRLFERTAVLLTAAAVLLLSLNRFSNGLSDYKSSGNLYEKTASSGGMPVLDKVDVTDGTRYTDAGLGNIRNAGWIHEDASGINFYMSFYNDRIDRFHNSVALMTEPWTFGFRNLNDRSELMALLGVNHLIAYTDSDEHTRAVSYTVPEASEGKLTSFASEGGTGIVSLFDQAMTEEEFLRYSPIQRQQVLLQRIVLEKGKNQGETEDETICLTEQEVRYKAKRLTKKVKLTANGAVTTGKDQEISLSFPEQADGELYLYFDNIRFEYNRTEDTYITVSACSGESVTAVRTFRMNNPWSHLYGGKHQWLVNLGRIPETADAVRIKFSARGNYTWDGIHVYVRHTEDVLNSMRRPDRSGIQVRAENNGYRIAAGTDTPKYMFVAVPYSEGWSAADKGQNMEILNADIGFMGFRLEPGEHEIVLSYHTPGMLAGGIVSIVSVLIFILILRRKRKQTQIRDDR